MDNQDFLTVVGNSFKKFLETGSRSNEKLKILHGAIAKDMKERLGDHYQVQSLGIGNGKEMKLDGRYIDKAVDITILHNYKPIAGIGVKFVMQNYSQNSNNYFENMLGETANIRCANIPYFQIFIIPDKLPYYKNDGTFQKWEEFTAHNSEKYLMLSKDDIQTSIHTPTKTLLFVVHLPDIEKKVHDKHEYAQYYEEQKDFQVCESITEYGDFSSAVIHNDYEKFAEKVVHYIRFL
ncbi:hypothetical protein [Prevotella sp. Rep29]|uniref:hypothetical protein n=1 Tax=Prevotella sp. Rep29 TaxID=2691580 RepID=UPI001C6E67DA|nr:hypothetical protein [Prevotella sp. Rep29]MBR3389038.1 hypothetical protein [Prevotella sp.]QYR10608.1 hypothetical protein GRF55_05655 [Prevotella sp. Rep29]